jgi:hypothetical protein
MPTTSNNTRFFPFQILLLAVTAVLALFAWQGSAEFSLWDEGFLWYGAQRVMLGEVPIRDFMSYDPGRYYWSAALMGLWGNNGIMALRGAVAVFQAMGLSAGLYLIARTETKWNTPYLLLSAVVLVAWMFPRHKLFDISLSIFLIGALASVVQSPTSRRYFLAGLCVGLVAVFGRNHGIYGAAGSVGVMLWLRLRRTDGPGLIKGFMTWLAGVSAGYLPVILMVLFVPGFAGAFWESIRFLFEVKATNLPLPVPWPWLVDFATVPAGEAIRRVLTGLFFMGTLVFGALSLLWIVGRRLQNRRVHPALVAASFLALPYAHDAYSRADVNHLAQSIFPMLIGCLVLLSSQSAKVRWTLALMLGVASLWVMSVFQPGWQCHVSKSCVNVVISRDSLQVDPQTARDVSLLRQLAANFAPDGQSFVTVPFWPGAYALLERKAPMWEIYPLFPRSAVFEHAEIARIEAARPGFALILDLPLDGQDSLRFRNTHPLTYRYIVDSFIPLPASPGPIYQIYKAKGLAQ